MTQHKNQQPDGRTGEQNPPLNNPVSHTDDDSKTTRSATYDEMESKPGKDNTQGSASIPLDKDETIGNP